MNLKYGLLGVGLLLMLGCKKDAGLLKDKTGTLTVEFVSFEESCNWNLEILNGTTVSDFHENYSSKFLHSDIDDFNVNGNFQIGDTLTIHFEVLEENPYPQKFILCNVHPGVPVKILDIL